LKRKLKDQNADLLNSIENFTQFHNTEQLFKEIYKIVSDGHKEEETRRMHMTTPSITNVEEAEDAKHSKSSSGQNNLPITASCSDFVPAPKKAHHYENDNLQSQSEQVRNSSQEIHAKITSIHEGKPGEREESNFRSAQSYTNSLISLIQEHPMTDHIIKNLNSAGFKQKAQSETQSIDFVHSNLKQESKENNPTAPSSLHSKSSNSGSSIQMKYNSDNYLKQLLNERVQKGELNEESGFKAVLKREKESLAGKQKEIQQSEAKNVMSEENLENIYLTVDQIEAKTEENATQYQSRERERSMNTPNTLRDLTKEREKRKLSKCEGELNEKSKEHKKELASLSNIKEIIRKAKERERKRKMKEETDSKLAHLSQALKKEKDREHSLLPTPLPESNTQNPIPQDDNSYLTRTPECNKASQNSFAYVSPHDFRQIKKTQENNLRSQESQFQQILKEYKDYAGKLNVNSQIKTHNMNPLMTQISEHLEESLELSPQKRNQFILLQNQNQIQINQNPISILLNQQPQQFNHISQPKQSSDPQIMSSLEQRQELEQSSYCSSPGKDSSSLLPIDSTMDLEISEHDSKFFSSFPYFPYHDHRPNNFNTNLSLEKKTNQINRHLRRDSHEESFNNIDMPSTIKRTDNKKESLPTVQESPFNEYEISQQLSNYLNESIQLSMLRKNKSNHEIEPDNSSPPNDSAGDNSLKLIECINEIERPPVLNSRNRRIIESKSTSCLHGKEKKNTNLTNITASEINSQSILEKRINKLIPFNKEETNISTRKPCLCPALETEESVLRKEEKYKDSYPYVLNTQTNEEQSRCSPYSGNGYSPIQDKEYTCEIPEGFCSIEQAEESLLLKLPSFTRVFRMQKCSSPSTYRSNDRSIEEKENIDRILDKYNKSGGSPNDPISFRKESSRNSYNPILNSKNKENNLADISRQMNNSLFSRNTNPINQKANTHLYSKTYAMKDDNHFDQDFGKVAFISLKHNKYRKSQDFISVIKEENYEKGNDFQKDFTNANGRSEADSESKKEENKENEREEENDKSEGEGEKEREISIDSGEHKKIEEEEEENGIEAEVMCFEEEERTEEKKEEEIEEIEEERERTPDIEAYEQSFSINELKDPDYNSRPEFNQFSTFEKRHSQDNENELQVLNSPIFNSQKKLDFIFDTKDEELELSSSKHKHQIHISEFDDLVNETKEDSAMKRKEEEDCIKDKEQVKEEGEEEKEEMNMTWSSVNESKNYEDAYAATLKIEELLERYLPKSAPLPKKETNNIIQLAYLSFLRYLKTNDVLSQLLQISKLGNNTITSHQFLFAINTLKQSKLHITNQTQIFTNAVNQIFQLINQDSKSALSFEEIVGGLSILCNDSYSDIITSAFYFMNSNSKKIFAQTSSITFLKFKQYLHSLFNILVPSIPNSTKHAQICIPELSELSALE
jgi:hypothetical protein